MQQGIFNFSMFYCTGYGKGSKYCFTKLSKLPSLKSYKCINDQATLQINTNILVTEHKGTTLLTLKHLMLYVDILLHYYFLMFQHN